MKSALLMSVLILCLLPDMARADTPRSTGEDDEAIKKVLKATSAAIRNLDWNEQAKWMDSEALEEFRRLLLPVLKVAEGNSLISDEVLGLFGATDFKTIFGLKANEFYARFIKGNTASQSPQAKEALATTEYEVIGIVYETKTLAHAVTRIKLKHKGVESSKLQLVSLKRSAVGWRLMLLEDTQVLADAIRRALLVK